MALKPDTSRRGNRIPEPNPEPLSGEEQEEFAPSHITLFFDALWRYRKPLGIALGILIVIFWVIPAGVKAGIHWIERRRSERLARLGQEYLEKGDRESARMSAETALRLSQLNADALRIQATLLGSDGRMSDTLAVYQKLAESGKATIPEFKNYALMASKGGYSSIADWIGGWVAQQGEPDFPYLVKAATFESQGQPAEALDQYRRAVEVAANNRTKRALTRFLLENSDLGESNAEVFSLLKDISRDEEEAGHEALIIGLLSGVVPGAERLGWLERLRAHRFANEQSMAIADAIEVEVNPAAKPRIISAMLERVHAQPLDDRMLAVRWLLRHGDAAQIEKILTPEEARTRPDLWALWLEGQATLGLWQTILDATANGSSSLGTGTLRLLRGQALKKCGRDGEGRQEYLRELSEAAGNPERLLPALAFLQSDGESEIFRQYAKPLLAGEATALPAIQYLTPVIAQDRDAKKLRDFLEFASQSGPLSNYPVLLNDMAYIDLVLGRPVDRAAISERATDFPENASFRFTLAFSQLCQGRKAKALHTAESPPTRIRDLNPQQQLILACALAANGQKDQAARIQKILAVSPITHQENDFLMKYLGAAEKEGNRFK